MPMRASPIRAWLCAALMFFLPVFPALAAAPDKLAPVRSLLEMRQDRVTVQAWDLSCGAAVLTTLLVHQFGENITERDVAVGMMGRAEYLDNPDIVRAREGFSLLDMQRYVARLGYTGEGYGQLTFDELIARSPAIVPVARHGYNHFVIVRGVSRDRVLIADPSFGTRTLRRDQFERIWKSLGDMGRVAFTIDDPQQIENDALRINGLAPRAADYLTFS
jgi:uncharacterized protein